MEPVYLDESRTDEERVRDLVSQMTLEEKVSQLRYDAPAVERLGIPSYNWWNEALHGVARAGENKHQRSRANCKLHPQPGRLRYFRRPSDWRQCLMRRFWRKSVM